MSGTGGLIAKILAIKALRERNSLNELKPRLNKASSVGASLILQKSDLVPEQFNPLSANFPNSSLLGEYKLPNQSEPNLNSQTILHTWYTGYKSKIEVVDPVTGKQSFEEVFVRTSTPEMAMLQLGLRLPLIGTLQEKHKMLAENGITVGHSALEHITVNDDGSTNSRYLSVGPGGEVIQTGEKQDQMPGKALLSGHIEEMSLWKPNKSENISDIVDQGAVARLIDAHHSGNDPDTKIHSKKRYSIRGISYTNPHAVNCASAVLSVLLEAGVSGLLPSSELAKIKIKPYFDPGDLDGIVNIAKANSVTLKKENQSSVRKKF